MAEVNKYLSMSYGAVTGLISVENGLYYKNLNDALASRGNNPKTAIDF